MRYEDNRERVDPPASFTVTSVVNYEWGPEYYQYTVDADELGAMLQWFDRERTAAKLIDVDADGEFGEYVDPEEDDPGEEKAGDREGDAGDADDPAGRN
jgi:hypothetical protein